MIVLKGETRGRCSIFSNTKFRFLKKFGFFGKFRRGRHWKSKNLGESNQLSQDSHENDISKTVLSKPEVENETIRVGNKGIQPFDRVYLRKKRPQRISPNDS